MLSRASVYLTIAGFNLHGAGLDGSPGLGKGSGQGEEGEKSGQLHLERLLTVCYCC